MVQNIDLQQFDGDTLTIGSTVVTNTGISVSNNTITNTALEILTTSTASINSTSITAASIQISNTGVAVDGEDIGDSILAATVYSTANELPLSGLISGTLAFVQDTDFLYFTDGSGWSKIATVNQAPNITSVLNANGDSTPFLIGANNSGQVVTVTATDPEVGSSVSHSVGSVTSGFANGATISQGIGANTNVFTIVAHSHNDANFNYTFSASDGISVGVNTANFSTDYSNYPKFQNISAEEESFNIGGTPTGIRFGDSGTKIYYIDANSNLFEQRNLSTAWDITTAGTATTVGTVVDNMTGLYISPDGSKMWAVAPPSTGGMVHYYTFGTPWSISTISYQSYYNPQTIANGDFDDIRDIYFKPDGTVMYLAGGSNNSGGDIGKWDLSTAWDISTATFDFKHQDIGHERSAEGITFSADGTRLYTADRSLNGNSGSCDRIFLFLLKNPWDITTLSGYPVMIASNVTAGNTLRGFDINPDGSKLYYTSTSGQKLYQCNTTEQGSVDAWTDIDPTTSVGGTNQSLRPDTGPNNANQLGFHFSPDGTKLYSVDRNNHIILYYKLRIPWNLVSALYVSSSPDLEPDETTPGSLWFKPDGTKFWLVGEGTDVINEYSCSTAWDVSTAGSATVYDILSTANPGTIQFKDDGSKFIVWSENDEFEEFTCSTAWDLSTATSTYRFSITASPKYHGVYINPEGTVLYANEANVEFSKYTFSTPWDLSTLSLTTTWTTGYGFQSAERDQIFIRPDGNRLYISSQGTNNRIDEFDVS
jgi:hypothetical protein